MDVLPNVGLQKVSLKRLDPDISNALIVGIIIAKQRPRRFANAKSSETGDRAVWNFTLRDSSQDYINVTFWGIGDTILMMSDMFQTGDIVEIIRPRISIRKLGDYGEQYRPMVTSPYSLTLYDNQSQILRHEGNAYKHLERLLNLPTKPLAGFVTLADVQTGGPSKVGEFVDILVAVKSVSPIRNVKTKEGIEQQVRDVMILDQTTSSLQISLWDPELMIRAGFWKPRLTILFMTDMKIEYNNFHKALMPVITSRTIITVDPQGAEAEILRTYARTAPLESLDILDKLCCSITDSNCIQNVMSVQQVLDKVDTLTESGISARTEDRYFTALLYAHVTQLDLDGLSKVTSIKCPHCKSQVSENVCQNEQCSVGAGIETADMEISFDIRITLTDHTGSISGCRLTGRTAEEVLNCTINNFMQMTSEEKCRLKWKYLLERCAVRIMVLCTNGLNPLIKIITCDLAMPLEVANRLPHY